MSLELDARIYVVINQTAAFRLIPHHPPPPTYRFTSMLASLVQDS